MKFWEDLNILVWVEFDFIQNGFGLCLFELNFLNFSILYFIDLKFTQSSLEAH